MTPHCPQSPNKHVDYCVSLPLLNISLWLLHKQPTVPRKCSWLREGGIIFNKVQSSILSGGNINSALCIDVWVTNLALYEHKKHQLTGFAHWCGDSRVCAHMHLCSICLDSPDSGINVSSGSIARRRAPSGSCLSWGDQPGLPTTPLLRISQGLEHCRVIGLRVQERSQDMTWAKHWCLYGWTE